MLLPAPALQSAAEALREISDMNPGERGRRAALVALVLRALERSAGDEDEGAFLRRRAQLELEGLPRGSERGLLLRLVSTADIGPDMIAELLGDYAAGLEDARRLDEAAAVMGLACALAPERADLALLAGRIARLRGDREKALELYRAASELDGGSGSVARLAAIGEAVVAVDSERALSRAIRAAIRAGDPEAAAVGLEERARMRRAAGRRTAAARDFGLAAVRFEDAVDRARVAHQLADLFIAGDDPRAAREALLFALGSGDATQRDHARARLHTVSRDLGDQVGMRRWRSFKPQSLVSLSSRPRVPAAHTAAPRVARWLEHFGALPANLA